MLLQINALVCSLFFKLHPFPRPMLICCDPFIARSYCKVVFAVGLMVMLCKMDYNYAYQNKQRFNVGLLSNKCSISVIGRNASIGIFTYSNSSNLSSNTYSEIITLAVKARP